jgi:hypothetical protein
MTLLLDHLPAAGWHPDPLEAGRERYYDGRCWTTEVRGGAVEVVESAPVAGWYDDPRDGNSLRYFDGKQWTKRVMPKPGTRPRPARGRGPRR